MYVVGSPIYDTIYLGTEGETLTRSASSVDATATTLTITATDLGDGYYRVTLTPTAAGVHVWIGESSSGIPVLFQWDVVTAAQANPVAYLGGVTVTVVSPVVDSGDVELYQGDDYKSVDARALIWSLTGAPDLTGAAVTLTITSPLITPLSVAGVITNAGSATQIVTVSLTRAQTATLLVGEPTAYDLSTTLADGDVVTLSRGNVTVF